MNLENVDFHSLCLDESPQLYGDIYPLDKHEFNTWIRQNLKEIGAINSYDEVIPDVDTLKTLEALGYEHIHYQCHYSARAAAILNPGFMCFNGFIERNSYPFALITHSFNIHNGSIVDLARIENPEDPFSGIDSSLPHTYYGIEFPRDFILKYQDLTLNDKSMKPLLLEWYQENN